MGNTGVAAAGPLLGRSRCVVSKRRLRDAQPAYSAREWAQSFLGPVCTRGARHYQNLERAAILRLVLGAFRFEFPSLPRCGVPDICHSADAATGDRKSVV